MTIAQLAVLALSWSAASIASEVYKWVGDDGVVHYSDTRPKHEASVTTLELVETNPKGYDPAEDPYSVLNQAKRVAASRKERVWAKQQAEFLSEDARDDPGYAYQPGAPFIYYPAAAYYPVAVPPRLPRRNQGAAGRQLDALDALGLGGRRPQSINSGVHRQRVLRSEALPLVTPPARRGTSSP